MRSDHPGKTLTLRGSLARSAGSASITSSYSMLITCAVCCHRIFNIITTPEHICRSTRIARRRAQYTRQPLARSLPSRRSVVCIIATNDALHELLGRSNRRTRFGARGRSALRCIAQMQWRPKPMHAAGIAAAANVLFYRSSSANRFPNWIGF